jgi:hypothetical protein
MSKVSRRSYRLLPGSVLLRPIFWWRAEQSQLKILIKRFATREDQARRRGLPTYVWRNRRLRAVAVYEARFEAVPALLRSRCLSRQESYYVQDGKYIWPERGKPGDPVRTRTAA